MPDRDAARERPIPGLRYSLVCPECGWLYGKTLHVPSHTFKVKRGEDECVGAGKEGISQRELVERTRGR